MKSSLIKKIVQVRTEPHQETIDENIKCCKRCKTELLVISRQTRSADEGATTFYNCRKCAKSIKVN